MKSLAAIPIIILVITGCATLTPGGQRTRTTSNPNVVQNCEFVGNVKGSSGWGGSAGSGIGHDQVDIQMQNQTALLGGNVLFITSSFSRGTTRGIGEAYLCR